MDGTREATIRKVTKWVLQGKEPIMWLSGLAGTGKSSLMGTLSDTFGTDMKRLAAFVRFDRNQAFEASLFVRTLAYKLAEFDNRLGTAIAEAIQQNRDVIHHTKLLKQFDILIREPLQKSRDKNDDKPVVVLIDGLDECNDHQQLLKLLCDPSLKHLPFLRILVASRPEGDIAHAFQSCPQILTFTLDTTSEETQQDIEHFMAKEFEGIALRNPEFQAMCDRTNALGKLSSRACGLFIWASTMTTFIAGRPMVRLLDALDTKVPLSALDALTTLYKTALQSFANETSDADIQSSLCLILGVIMAFSSTARHGPTVSIIRDLTNISDVEQLLQRMGSIVSISHNTEVELLHKSFDDFLLDKSRCGESWYIHLPDHRHKLAAACLSQACTWLKSLDTEGKALWSLRSHPEPDNFSNFALRRLWNSLDRVDYKNIPSESPIPKLLQEFFQLYWLRFLLYRGRSLYASQQDRLKLNLHAIAFSEVTLLFKSFFYRSLSCIRMG
jgi:hypothetical protein